MSYKMDFYFQHQGSLSAPTGFLRQAADEQDPDLDRLLEALLEVGGPGTQQWLQKKNSQKK